MNQNKLLEITDLQVSFRTYGGDVQAVRGVSFHVNEGETVAIVGESGCGKSVTAKSIMRLIPQPPGSFKGGSILFQGKEITSLDEKDMYSIRGSQMGMIFQDPMTSLNPTMTVGKQIAEMLTEHRKISAEEAKKEAIHLLSLVGIPNPEARWKQYPHEYSGGMRQRVMIALAIACRPALLIADEPVTALDVTIQAQILDLMEDLQQQFGTAILIITHDLGVVAEIAQRVVVMYAGKVVESGSVEDIFYNPQHPYTWGLLQSIPKLDVDRTQELIPIQGTPPDLFSPPKGCAFAKRCRYAMEVCKEHQPESTQVNGNHYAACWLLDERAVKVDRFAELIEEDANRAAEKTA
ncbi:oligopeptide transport system ATP-binding protein [Paenibacillus sp. yr247]|uniref:ABC transporter ATP-binding protein n=1 Tax=Paenibacillus sp. yr247 TaxID=1761880 RepID=UPI00089237EF|nr:ABC transporter ATP-binding protein [Paenibacillus sp. yr247]SDP13676.1 oligopeptide transport system ATP-binding protein [Paenibacillus sp. yr247]